MNWQHLKAVVWLRGRLFRNQLRRSGTVNTVFTTILIVLALLTSISMFFVSLVLGMSLLPSASPDALLLLWSIAIVAFLFFWLTGLMTELQRSDVLSFQNLLHFPISLSGTLLVNYLSTFFSISLITFLPAMIGLCIASVVAIGPAMLVTFPLLAGFVLMVTAVTYQFRGWLAALMVNKRRRRTIIACVTAGFIILCQIPNLWNIIFMRSLAGRRPVSHEFPVVARQPAKETLARGGQKTSSKREPPEALHRAIIAQRKQAEAFVPEGLSRWLPMFDAVVPPGWLAYGTMAAARHNVWPGLLGSFGFALIAGASLRRSYRTTLQFYRGDQQTRRVLIDKAAPRVKEKGASSSLEGRLLWVPDQAAAIARANFRSLIRAPEVKMMLLTPILFGAFFGFSMLARRSAQMPDEYRPLLAFGAIAIVSLGVAPLFQNQFGFDRDGFRVYVLCPAARRSILFGKNLALAPLVLGLGAIALTATEVMCPLRITHFLASFIQLVSAYLILCIVGNHTSILLPSAVRAGSLRASKVTTVESLLRFVAYLALMIAFVPMLIPLGAESLGQSLGVSGIIPVYLILSAFGLAVLIFVYRELLEYHGDMLQSREQKILEAVTTKSD